MSSLLSIYLDIAQKHGRFTPLPRIPDNALPVAGDTVTLRNGNVATVLAVGTGDFDEPVFYLDTRVTVLRYSITGICEQVRAA